MIKLNKMAQKSSITNHGGLVLDNITNSIVQCVSPSLADCLGTLFFLNSDILFFGEHRLPFTVHRFIIVNLGHKLMNL